MANAQVATPKGTFDVDANGNPIIPGQQAASGNQPPARGLLAPRFAASLPNYLPGFGYDNAWDQTIDAHGMANRYTQSFPWGNGLGRFAYGSGAPYGNPAGRNAPWYVTGANGQGGQYPNPGTILGQGPSTVPPGQPGANTGLLGKPQPKVDGGLLGSGLNPAAPNSLPPAQVPANPGMMQQFNAAPDNLTLQGLYRQNPQFFRDLILSGKLSNNEMSQIAGGLGDPNTYPRVGLR